ncbi:MAG TPA: ChaN family lipoprotein [Saliniramus sp.]|nr:ChaN family lipoprotein [Saliniramus sp.]
MSRITLFPMSALRAGFCGVLLVAFHLLAPSSATGLTGEADIHVLGEVHDNPAHHLRQAEIVERVQPAALVFEMLTPAQARAAQGVPRDDAAALSAALEWEGSGWPDFNMYHPIFVAAPEAEIFGAALPRETLTRARLDGAAAAFGLDATQFGLVPLDADDQAAREAEQASAHCDMLPEDLLPGMVEVQRMRDAHFARVAVDAHTQAGGPVVVITGNGHARTDVGIPAALAIARPDLEVVALGQLEMEPEGDVPFDAIAVSPGPERDDPCAVFR